MSAFCALPSDAGIAHTTPVRMAITTWDPRTAPACHHAVHPLSNKARMPATAVTLTGYSPEEP